MSSTEELENGSTPTRRFDVVKEAKKLLRIALPTVAVQFNVFFIFPQTASAVGRNLGTEELASFSLASLTGNIACLSVIIGVLTATDTLMPRAFGTGHYLEVGRLAVRGFTVCTLVLIVPCILLTTCMDFIFETLGQDPFVSMGAAMWLRAYVVGVPFVLLFRVTQRFLASQKIVHPLLYASAIGCFLIHPALLRFCMPHVGFMGSVLAIVMTQIITDVLLFLYLKLKPVHHPESWPRQLNWSFFKESIQPEPMIQFWRLSLGGVLSFSEWWFWETVCFIAGHLGVIPLCIHTVAYNLIPVMFMIPLGMSIGLSVRMGHVLSKDVTRAKQLALMCMAFTVGLAFFLVLGLFVLQSHIVALFTHDPKVIRGCQQIWPFVCLHIFIMYIFGINSGILRALGLQWRMAAIITGVLWFIALPTLFHLVVYRKGGVDAIWKLLPCFYLVMNVGLVVCYTTADWHAISKSIRERAHQQGRLELQTSDEKTPLTRQSIESI